MDDEPIALLLEKRLVVMEGQVRELLVQVTSLSVHIRLGLWLVGIVLVGGAGVSWRQLLNVRELLRLLDQARIFE